MKHITNVVIIATVFVLGVAPKARAWEDKECSNATLQGSFGYTSTGTLLPSYVPPPFAGPFGEVGRQTFDGKGHTDATATLSANGNIQPVTIQGTYTVNSDCTGSMTLNVSPLDVTVHAYFVIDDDGTELRAIGTDSGLVETRVYKKQFRGDCEDQSKLKAVCAGFSPAFQHLLLSSSAASSNCDRRGRISLPRRKAIDRQHQGGSRLAGVATLPLTYQVIGGTGRFKGCATARRFRTDHGQL